MAGGVRAAGLLRHPLALDRAQITPPPNYISRRCAPYPLCPIPIMIAADSTGNAGALMSLSPINRCRLVLVADPSIPVTTIGKALQGGDVASVILHRGEANEKDFQAWCETVTPVIQSAGAAALIADSTQVAARAKADGVHMSGSITVLKDAVEKLTPRLIVGAGTNGTRDDALDKGELRPDYMFFGKLDGDTHPQAHPKNIEMGEWWAEVIELPCIVMGGYAIESIAEIAKLGVEFVALSAAVFGEGRDAREQVAAVNTLLEEVGAFVEAANA
jgi:thiamine-phosphate pyrophosphorylase